MFRQQEIDSKLTEQEIVLIRAFRKMPKTAQTSMFRVAVSYADKAVEEKKREAPKLRLV